MLMVALNPASCGMWSRLWASQVPCPICGHFLFSSHSFIPYLLALLEVFLNPAPLAAPLCLSLSLHLSTCPSASPTSRSRPTPLSSITRRWMGLCHTPGSSQHRCSVWGKCQSLTEGGGGRKAGWKMSSFTGKSCEPRNVSSTKLSSPPPLLPLITFCGRPVCVWE